MTVLLLPDFVGHPITFSPVFRAFDHVTWITINYKDYGSLDSISALAAAISEDISGREVDAIVGYSFGGLVGFEVSLILSSKLKVPPLMIDSSLCLQNDFDPPKHWTSYLRPELLATISCLTELGEIVPDILDNNIRLFKTYVPGGKLAAGALVSTCESDTPFKSSRQWRKWFHQLLVHRTKATHESVLAHPDTLKILKNHFLGGLDGDLEKSSF